MPRLSSLLPRPRPEPDDGARIIGLEEDVSEEVFDALSSETTRDVLRSVYSEVGTASDIADRVDTSLQNARYHLDKLIAADLVEAGETWYSDQGNEMKVYTPTNESVILLASERERTSQIRELLKRLLGTMGILVFVSFIANNLIRMPSSLTFVGKPVGSHSILPTITMGGLLTPGVVFFAGGLSALLVLLVLSNIGRFER